MPKFQLAIASQQILVTVDGNEMKLRQCCAMTHGGTATVCRIPDGISHAKSEVGVLQKKWSQRGDLPLSEVGPTFAGVPLITLV